MKNTSKVSRDNPKAKNLHKENYKIFLKEIKQALEEKH